MQAAGFGAEDAGRLRARWLGLAAAALVMAGGCAPSPSPPAVESPPAAAPQQSRLAPGTPKRGGKFVLATHDDITSWDPYAQTSGTRLKQFGLVMDSLLNWPPSKTGAIDGVECTLCEKWKQLGPTTFQFSLKQGVRFHNGRELVADDVLWSYQHALSDNPTFRYKSSFALIDFERSQAVDTYTVKLLLKRPFVPFIKVLGDPFHPILAKEMMESAKDGIIQEPMGTGPYIRTSYTPKVGATFKRNPGYREKDKAFFDEMEVVIISSHPERFNAFRAGRVDDHGLFMPFETAETIRIDGRFYGVTAPRDSPGGIQFNLRKPPFDHVKVRRALDVAVDRFSMIKANYGEGFLYRWLNSGIFPDYAPSEDEIKRMPGYRVAKDEDVSEAKRLLAEAGYPQGFKATMLVAKSGNNEQDAVLVREDWKKIGLDVTLDPQPQTIATQREVKGEFEVYFRSAAIVTGNEDPDKSFERWLPGVGIYARNTGFDNPRFTQLMQTQRRELDKARRTQLIKEIVKLMEEEMPGINTVTETYFRFWPVACKGLVPESGYGDVVRWVATDAWCER